MFSSHQSWTFLWANHQITFASWNFKFFCGVWAITTLSTRNHHSKSMEFGSNFILSDFSKSVRIRLKFHIFFNWWKDVVVWIINILLRRVEFGIWLSKTTEKFEISRGSVLKATAFGMHWECWNNIYSIKTIKANRATRQQCAPGECWHLLSGSENLIGNRCLVSIRTCGPFLSSGNSSVNALSFFSATFSWFLVTFYNRRLTTGTLAPSLVCQSLSPLEVHNTTDVQC